MNAPSWTVCLPIIEVPDVRARLPSRPGAWARSRSDDGHDESSLFGWLATSIATYPFLLATGSRRLRPDDAISRFAAGVELISRDTQAGHEPARIPRPHRGRRVGYRLDALSCGSLCSVRPPVMEVRVVGTRTGEREIRRLARELCYDHRRFQLQVETRWFSFMQVAG
jgi:hypothetical protein